MSINFYLADIARKYKTLYLIYNKSINAYKFGITSKPIKERIYNYCNDLQKFCFIKHDNQEIKQFKYIFTENDIELLFCKELNNVQLIEKELMKMINGCRLKLEGQQYPFREHFTGVEKANELLYYLNNL